MPPVTAAQQALLATGVAAALVIGTTAPDVTSSVAVRFAAQGISRRALATAIGVVMAMPPEAAGFHGPATATAARTNLVRRAQFVVAAARRLQGDITGAISRREPVVTALLRGAQRERRYYGQHLQAMWNRASAAAQVDSEAMTHGDLLGWYTVLDSHTSPECRAADRHNFRASQMPLIGYPGAVHPHCRCRPGPPVPGAPMVGQNARARQHAYA